MLQAVVGVLMPHIRRVEWAQKVEESGEEKVGKEWKVERLI